MMIDINAEDMYHYKNNDGSPGKIKVVKINQRTVYFVKDSSSVKNGEMHIDFFKHLINTNYLIKGNDSGITKRTIFRKPY